MNERLAVEFERTWTITALPGYVFPIAVIALVGFLFYRSHRKRRQREEETRQAARQDGWRWEQTDPTLVDRWTLEPFGSGRRRTARNVVYGEHNGWSFVAFDYHYTTGGGRSSRQHDYSVYVLTLSGTLPRIQAEPEGLFGGRVARAFGVGDLQLGDEELDRMWKIRSEDEAFAHALFHDRMRQLLRRTGGWTWGFEGNTMVSAHSGTLSAAEIRPRLDLMTALIGEVPDEVWRTYGTPSRA